MIKSLRVKHEFSKYSLGIYRRKRGQKQFHSKGSESVQDHQLKTLKTAKLNVSLKKTAYNLFFKDKQNTKNKLQNVPVSKASAIISEEWKKNKASDKKMKKYRDL